MVYDLGMLFYSRIFYIIFYRETISSDSALIVLATPLVLNDRVKPIRLAPHNHEPKPNGTCVNTGWGNSNYFGTFPRMIPEQLQKVELKIIERSKCQERMGAIKKVDNTMICAGDGPRKGACQVRSACHVHITR